MYLQIFLRLRKKLRLRQYDLCMLFWKSATRWSVKKIFFFQNLHADGLK